MFYILVKLKKLDVSKDLRYICHINCRTLPGFDPTCTVPLCYLRKVSTHQRVTISLEFLLLRVFIQRSFVTRTKSRTSYSTFRKVSLTNFEQFSIFHLIKRLVFSFSEAATEMKETQVVLRHILK